MLNENQIEEFKENGVLVIPNFYNYEEDIKPIQEGIYNIIGLILRKYKLDIKRTPFNGDNFSQGYLETIKINRKYGGEIYDAIKQLPAFMRFISKKDNEEVLKDLRKSNQVGISIGGFGIRIDNPNESQYNAPWHQEYPNQLRSPDGIVLWAPLIDISSQMGPVEILSSTHKLGFVKYINHNKNSHNTNNHTLYGNNFEILDIKKLEKTYKKVAPLTNVCDLVIMDHMTIHKSGVNKSDVSRWSMQIRYFNFENEEGQKINWSGSFAAGKHPIDFYPDNFIDGE